MIFTLHLDPLTYTQMIIIDDSIPSRERFIAVDTELLSQGDLVHGLAYLKGANVMQVNAYVVERPKKIIRPSVKVITPISLQSKEMSFVYHKNMIRTIGGLYADSYGYGNVEALELNPHKELSLRRRTAHFGPVEAGMSTFYEVKLEVHDFEGWIFYYHHQYPLLIVPFKNKDTKAS